LQEANNPLIDGAGRRALAVRALGRIRQQQASSHLSGEFEPGHLLLAMRSLTMFPLAFPQLTRLITGQPASDPHFQKKYAAFLKKFAAAFRPAGGRHNKTNFAN
jgi:hypothetical protein